jgi:hypothetical protein
MAADRRVTAKHLRAGRDYLAALREHGFEPEGMCWAVHKERGEASLVLVTAPVDRIGPAAVHEILFKAYDAAVTPPAIDPWIVALYSPAMALPQALDEAIRSSPVEGERPPNGSEEAWDLGGYEMRRSWIIVWPIPRPSAAAQLRGWKRFEGEVRALAA